MSYELCLSLQQMSALRVAISFWERKEVKDSMKNFFNNSSDMLDEYKNIYRWKKFTKASLDEWNKDILSLHLEVDVAHIVNKIGEEIYHWHWYIKYKTRYNEKTEEETIKYIDNIHWTSYGTIDEIETFKSFWFENPSFEIAPMYYIACKYVLNEYLNDFLNKLCKPVSILEYWNHEEQILAYWRYIHNGNLSDFIGSWKRNIYNRHYSAEVNMLWLSLEKGHSTAVKYFWKKLDEEEKNKNILNCAGIALIRYSDDKQAFVNERYNRIKYVEICIFLMSHMTRDQKKLFFNDVWTVKEFNKFVHVQHNVKSKILKMFLSAWPWQELFITAFNDMLQYTVLDSKTVSIILLEITAKMVENHELGYDIKFSKYRKLLREVWLIIPGFIKQKMVQENLFSNFTCNLIHVWDLDRIKMIFNDQEIIDVRDQYIESGKQKYRLLIMNDQFEFLDQFMEKVFTSEEEKKCFKQKIYDWYGSIETDQFCLPETVSNWETNTPHYILLLKRLCEDHINLIQVFIKCNRHDLVDKFINWTCETEEEKNKCKDNIKNTRYSIKWLCEIWEECKRKIGKESNRFLDWLLDSEMFTPVWNDMVQHVELDSKTMSKVLYKISSKIVENYQLGYAVKNNTYQKMLGATWLTIPECIKQNIKPESLKLNFIHHLLQVWDLDNIKLIFNDPKIANNRDQYIKSGMDQYKNLIKNDKFELLDQFIEEIFRDEDEKKNFKWDIDCWYDLILEDQYHQVEKLLDWQCITSQERQFIKRNIDYVKVCKVFLEKRKYDLIDKFLNWKCETEEEKKRCRNHFYTEYMT